jgi:membrane fusion protein (multidrug efflux system)
MSTHIARDRSRPPAGGRNLSVVGSASPKPEDRRRPVLVGTIVLLVLALAAVGGLGYWFWSIHYAATDDAAVDGAHVSVSARAMGRIASLPVDEGARVEAGQLLVQLDDSELRAQAAQLSAAVTNAGLGLNLSRIGLEKAKNDFQRAKALFSSGNSSAEQYDHAAKALDAADAQYAIAQAQVEAARAQLGVVETQIQTARITAPISGIVARRSYAQGEVVQPGAAILLVNDLSDVWVVANYEETKIRLIHPGDPVRIRVDAYPQIRFHGRVAQIAAAIVPPPFSIGESTKVTQKIPVKIAFDAIPDGAVLVPGMSVETTIKVR